MAEGDGWISGERYDMDVAKCRGGEGHLMLRADDEERERRPAEELDELYNECMRDGTRFKSELVGKFTEEEVVWLGKQHHWAVAIYAGNYYLKGDNMSREDARAKIYGPLGGSSSNRNKKTMLLV